MALFSFRLPFLTKLGFGLSLWLTGLAYSPLAHASPPSDLDAWLYQHPEISGQIVWEFPDVIPELNSVSVLAAAPTVFPWMKTKVLGNFNLSTSSIDNLPSVNPGSPSCPQGSCPANPDLDPGAGMALQWYYWPPAYKQRLKDYFNQYWQWMETSWPLYRQYKESGFTQKPAGFDERFGHNLDPQTQNPPSLLPVAFEKMITSYTHVLYEPAAVIDLYLKVLAMQLVLEIGDFLEWKLGDYNRTDLALVLDGRSLFTYFPEGGEPWDNHQTDKEGYLSSGAYPAPPLVTMNFLFREGIVRDTRWDTVSQLLEWQRFNLQHTMGNQQSLTGECGKEFNEVYWGVKGNHPLDRILHGTVMACRLIPAPGSNTSGYYSPDRQHYTGGCGGTGGISHRVLSLINIPAERKAFTHAQMRFVVERAPFEQMLSTLEPLLPSDPAISDGLPMRYFSGLTYRQGSAGNSSTRGQTPGISKPFRETLTGAYLDHNDNPYGLEAYPDIPVKEALIPEATYERWFRKPPEGLSEEQERQYYDAHNKRVSLRPVQLKIARLPHYLFYYYCWKQDAGKPHAETETYQSHFAERYTPEELEATGFWERFERKLSEEYGGCPGVPSIY